MTPDGPGPPLPLGPLAPIGGDSTQRRRRIAKVRLAEVVALRRAARSTSGPTRRRRTSGEDASPAGE